MPVQNKPNPIKTLRTVGVCDAVVLNHYPTQLLGLPCHRRRILYPETFSRKRPSHYYALLGVVAATALPGFAIPRRADLHGGPAADGSADHGQTLLRALVARVGSLDIPDVGFEDVAAAADAHFGEVADGVLRLNIAWESFELAIDLISMVE